MLNPLDHSICLDSPKRLTPHSAWIGHIPFAMFLVDILKPCVIVELGSHNGESYCAFCQAVKELKLDTTCFAIDTWEGDPQAGHYGPDVLADLKKHHDPLYSDFSTLVQKTFDEALTGFDDGSVDLLHIDGLHTYEAVKHDFESWLPKISKRGVILFHDISVRENDFGVWRLWEELKPRYPHFEFKHSYGLGVIGVGNDLPQEVVNFFNMPALEANKARLFFNAVGDRLEKPMRVKRDLESRLTEIEAQLVDANHRIEAMLNSASWKVTAPLRKVSSIVKGDN